MACLRKSQVLLPPWKNRVDFTGHPSYFIQIKQGTVLLHVQNKFWPGRNHFDLVQILFFSTKFCVFTYVHSFFAFGLVQNWFGQKEGQDKTKYLWFWINTRMTRTLHFSQLIMQVQNGIPPFYCVMVYLST